MILKKIGPQGLICPHPRAIYMYITIISSETAWPIKAKFYVKHQLEGVLSVYINNPGHMTWFFSRTGGLISKKLGMKHGWLKYYNVYINHDPVMTLTFFLQQGQHRSPMHLNRENF